VVGVSSDLTLHGLLGPGVRLVLGGGSGN
jgi:hypothetical protein